MLTRNASRQVRKDLKGPPAVKIRYDKKVHVTATDYVAAVNVMVWKPLKGILLNKMRSKRHNQTKFSSVNDIKFADYFDK